MWYTILINFLKSCILFMLLTVVPVLSPLTPSTQPLNTPSDNPHTIVHGPCMYVLWLLCSLCFTLHPYDYSVTTNLYFLIPSPFSPILLTLLLSGYHQNVLCIYDSVSVLIVYFVFLDSINDRYVFIAISLFIILIFFLKKTL